MEGGQKVNIPLDSGLDIKSSDMLVDIQQPKFQHNRQNYQGHYLPSSLRFEHDGYAAGNDVYQFNISTSVVEAGSYTVIKQNINDNPTYKFIVRDSDERIVASAIYVPGNSVLNSDVSDAAISDGAYPDITGVINGNKFSVQFDSISHEFTNNNGENSPIIITGSSINEDYTIELKLQDKSNTLFISFEGLQLPSEEIYNGDYILGKFSAFSNNKATWSDTGFTVNISDIDYTAGKAKLSVSYNSKSVPVNGADYIEFSFDNGYRADVSFTADIDFSDMLTVTRQEFTPLIADMSLSVKQSVISNQASSDLDINTSSAQMSDLEHNSSSNLYNQDKLYRNVPERSGGRSDYNRQTVTQKFPLWYGFTAQNLGIVYKSPSEASIVSSNGYALYKNTFTLDRWFPDYYNIGSNFENANLNDDDDFTYQQDTFTVQFIVDNSILAKYDISMYDIPENSIHTWHNTLDKLSEYWQRLDVSDSIIINIKFKSYNDIVKSGSYSYTDDYGAEHNRRYYYVGQNEASHGTVPIKLSSFWKILSLGDLKKCLKITWHKRIPYYKKDGGLMEYKSSGDTFTDVDMSSSWAISATYTQGVLARYRLDSSDPWVSGGNITLDFYADTITYYNNNFSVKGQTGTGNSFVSLKAQNNKSLVYWGTPLWAAIASDVYIKTDSLLTSSLDATAFGVDEASDKIQFSGVMDASSLFRHKVVSAYYMYDKINIQLALCSKDLLQPMFYVSQVPTEEANKISVLPGNIMTGLRKDMYDEKMSGLSIFVVNKTYSDMSSDSDYNLFCNISGFPVQTKYEDSFSYIKDILSSIDIDDLVPNNTFTEEYASDFISKLKFKLLSVNGWVDISTNSIYNYDFFKEHTQKIQLLFNNDVLSEYDYPLENKLIELSGSTKYSGYDIMFASRLLDSFNKDSMIEAENMQIDYHTTADYAVSLQLPGVLDNSEWSLVKLSNSLAVADSIDGTRRLNINISKLYVTMQEMLDTGEWSSERDTEIEWTDLSKYSFSISVDDIRTLLLILNGVYNSVGMEIKRISNSRLVAEINGEEISIDINKLLHPVKNASMLFTCIDINSGNLKSKQFASLPVDSEKQFLKQQWDTDNSTENFWWINSTHILALTKYAFVLRQKASDITGFSGETVSDWDGDIFVDKAEWQRSDIISYDIIKYLVTTAYKAEQAYLLLLNADKNNIKVKVYSPMDNMSYFDIDIPIKLRSIGQELCPDSAAIYSYSEFENTSMLSAAKVSATCVDGYIILGIHYDNNFNQWACVISLQDKKLVNVIQGYGYVGVNGCLTGGEIPSKYFSSSRGFTGTVMPLSVLENTESQINNLNTLYNVSNRIVGTAEQQWYITKNITDIVSHLTYSGGGIFSVQLLPLNNNYSVDYASGSFMSTIRSETSLRSKSVNSIFPDSNSVLDALYNLSLRPNLYYIAPRISIANYLQQTIGQAAYVHYNSSAIDQNKDMPEEDLTGEYDPNNADKETEIEQYLTTDELSFDKQSIKQTLSNSDPYTGVFYLCAAALTSALDVSRDVKDIAVNKFQNQQAVKDVGRKYTQNFLQNLNNISSMSMSLKSMNPSQTSEVTAIKSLDMFYSTSDRQNICAGPGFVNHNFVAQCVVQSATSVQSMFKQQRLSYIISALTEFTLWVQYKALETIREGLVQSVNANSGGAWFVGGIGSTGSNAVGAALAVAAQVSYVAASTAMHATDISLKLLPKITQSIGGDKLNSTIYSFIEDVHYDIEGKHKYGNKSEVFMWPCFGVSSRQSVPDESVEVVMQRKDWKLNISVGSVDSNIDSQQANMTTIEVPSSVINKLNGNVPYAIAMVKGSTTERQLPAKMAYVIGAEAILPQVPFKNENIGVGEPSFGPPPLHDYIIDESWELSRMDASGMTAWIGCKDTKIIDGEMSNCFITEDFCGVAAPYTAIEIKRGIDSKYVRPFAITPQVLALNQTGLNCCFEEKAYHAFDGYGPRIVNWLGSAGMNKEYLTQHYSFLINDRFKRSNKVAANVFLGNFKSEPVVAIKSDYNDKLFTRVEQFRGKLYTAGVPGEDKDVRRYALPVFTEFVNTLPAAVKTLSVVQLSVIDGITTLCTNLRELQSAYKAPVSVDFTIGRNMYRFTQEYICSLQVTKGITTLEQLVPCLGLTFIGATPYEAYLYSQDTKQYYMFTGGTSIQLVDMIERFRDVVSGRYDFVNQEVLLPSLATFIRLDSKVLDDEDETDNVIIPRLKNGQFAGEIYPPVETIFNTRSWFKTISLPSGVAYQGPNRCIINRFTFQDYMASQIKDNYGLWKRVPREQYHPFRVYKAKYNRVTDSIGSDVEVSGWTHNPFLLVTSPLGISENTDCIFEWELTFCWPVEMDKLYGQDDYAVVNVQAETMTPGGKVIAERPAHIFLNKQLFTRTDNYGYYSFRYQSKCGAGNRERLHIWSDQYICLSSLQCEYKAVTSKRTEQLTQQVDIQKMHEV